jgi:hypothetical protein
MAATDHTCLRTARPSADAKSTDISRNLPPGMEAPPGTGPACDAEITPSDPHGSRNSKRPHGGASASTEAAREVQADPPLGRTGIRRHVGTVCDYLELGVALANKASQTIAVSPDAADQSLARMLDALAGRIEEEIWGLRQATLDPAALARTLDRCVSAAETVPQ